MQTLKSTISRVLAPAYINQCTMCSTGEACLEHVVLCGEREGLAGDGEGDVGHFGDLLALHQRLGGGEDGQRVAQRVQLRDDLLLRLVVGQCDLRAAPQAQQVILFRVTECSVR